MYNTIHYDVNQEKDPVVRGLVRALIGKTDVKNEDRKALNEAMEKANKAPEQQARIRTYINVQRMTKENVGNAISK